MAGGRDVPVSYTHLDVYKRQPQRVASGCFDELVIHDRGLHYLFARKDNQVLMAYYIGEENLEDHLPELEEMMDMLSGK